jgi:hypothetical protein
MFLYMIEAKAENPIGDRAASLGPRQAADTGRPASQAIGAPLAR